MIWIALGAALVLIGLDQLTKWLAITYVLPQSSIPVINIGGHEILNFTYYENTGAAFSILKDKRMFLIIVTSVTVLVVLVLLLSKRIKRPWMIWSFALILAGGAGNLIDRIARGFVVDFIDVRIINFAVFNVADMCAVVGGVMLFLSVLYDDIRDRKEKKRLKLAGEAVVTESENKTDETSTTNAQES